MTPKRMFKDACRQSIKPLMPQCKKGYERHHANIRMAELVERFIDEYNIDIYSVNYFCDGFVDPMLIELFRQYHEKYAEYQIVTRKQHKMMHII